MQIIQTRQEGDILSMMEFIKEAQLAEAEYNHMALEESLANAELRLANYENLLAAGMLAEESSQVDLMGTGADLMLASSIIKMVSGASHLVPATKNRTFQFWDRIRWCQYRRIYRQDCRISRNAWRRNKYAR